jgi:CDP-paratose 2-epimerase
VYNMGGARQSNCSLLEAITICQEITGHPVELQYCQTNRKGDHIWWISNVGKFCSHYPNWKITKGTKEILQDIFQANIGIWRST